MKKLTLYTLFLLLMMASSFSAFAGQAHVPPTHRSLEWTPNQLPDQEVLNDEDLLGDSWQQTAESQAPVPASSQETETAGQAKQKHRRLSRKKVRKKKKRERRIDWGALSTMFGVCSLVALLSSLVVIFIAPPVGIVLICSVFAFAGAGLFFGYGAEKGTSSRRTGLGLNWGSLGLALGVGVIVLLIAIALSNLVFGF